MRPFCHAEEACIRFRIYHLQKLRFFCNFFHYNYWKNIRYVAVEFFVNLYMIRSEMMNYITISFVTQRRYLIHQPFTEARRYRTLDMFDEISIEISSNHDTVILLHRGNLYLFSGFFHDHFAVEASLKYATSFNCETGAKIALIFGLLYSLYKHIKYQIALLWSVSDVTFNCAITQ